MKDLLARLHALIDPIALKILNWMNGLVGIIAAGITGFTALHPNFAAEVQASLHLTPTQGMILSMVWCSIVAWLVKRAAKVAQ